MANKIKSKYRGKCVGYLLRYGEQGSKDVEYQLLTLRKIEDVNYFFERLLTCEDCSIVRTFEGVKDLSSNVRFTDYWWMQRNRWLSDVDAITSLEYLIMQS